MSLLSLDPVELLIFFNNLNESDLYQMSNVKDRRVFYSSNFSFTLHIDVIIGRKFEFYYTFML